MATAKLAMVQIKARSSGSVRNPRQVRLEGPSPCTSGTQGLADLWCLSSQSLGSQTVLIWSGVSAALGPNTQKATAVVVAYQPLQLSYTPAAS